MQPWGRETWLLSALPGLHSQRESRLRKAPMQRKPRDSSVTQETPDWCGRESKLWQITSPGRGSTTMMLFQTGSTTNLHALKHQARQPEESCSLSTIYQASPHHQRSWHTQDLNQGQSKESGGPDNILGHVLRTCAGELADALTDIFNISLSQAIVPRCFKTSTIIPVAKKSVVSCLNDYRPVALTPIEIKCFERLVKPHIKASLPALHDPYHLAYRPERSIEDAISTTLHSVITHLHQKDTFARILYSDFSSAFNANIPQKLMEKLLLLGLNTAMCLWIKDFLTERPQSVHVGNNTSNSITLSTGSPQGCVLSPLLFTLLTHDCASRHKENQIIKFVDDTTMVGLIHRNDELMNREEVKHLEGWCRENNVALNVDKTKEMIIDFRRSQPEHAPLSISGRTVERVENIKFLRLQISQDLKWNRNTSGIAKQAQQRLYFPRKLKQASLPISILRISTVMWWRVFWHIVSLHGTPAAVCQTKKDLQRIVRGAERVIRVSLPSGHELFQSRCRSRALSIIRDASHPLHTFFELLPSGKRFWSHKGRTNRLINSFLSQAVRLMNCWSGAYALIHFTSP